MIVEKATMSEETIMPLETYKKNKAPYFSIILVPYEVSK
jgi:precorrin-2 methylase